MAANRGVERILVRGVNWLGDAVMTTPALGAIRAGYPQARITLLAIPPVAALLQNHPAIDEVMVYDRDGEHRGIGGRLRIARDIRRCGFDLAILLQNALDAAVIAWLAGIPRRLGYATDGRRPLLTASLAVTPQLLALHHVDYYLAMLAHFGIRGGERRLLLATTRDEDEAAASFLRENGIADGDLVIGINPGAAYGSAKRWYPDRFAEVARELAAAWGGKILITGGGGEREIAAAIEEALGGNCLNVAGRTDVRRLMALIKRCGFFVTNDSGPMHIAAAFAVPLVAIFGSTDHTTTSPFSDGAVIVRRDTDCAPCLKRECPTDHRCMTSVTAADVVQAALELGRRSGLRERG